MISQTYAAIMDANLNPLRNLPKVVRFQIMSVLALMWSIVFCTWTGLMIYVGPSMAVHAVLLIGVFFTADVFRRTRTERRLDHRQMYRDDKDGCARYDDLWGA